MRIVQIMRLALGIALTAGLFATAPQASAQTPQSSNSRVATAAGAIPSDQACDTKSGERARGSGVATGRYHCHCVTPYSLDVVAAAWHEIELPAAFERPVMAAAHGDGVSSALAPAQAPAVAPPLSILFGNFRS